MNRLKMFSAPHKALRKLMGEMALLAGQTDAGDLSAVEALKIKGEELFFLLKIHAESEDNIVLKMLEQKAPGTSQQNTAEHESLEKKQNNLHNWLRCLGEDSSQEDLYLFYLAFTEFQSLYLEHILHEEGDTQNKLETHFTDGELGQMLNEIIRHLPFDHYLLWLKHMFGSHSPSERSQIWEGLKVALPEKDLLQVQEMVKTAG